MANEIITDNLTRLASQSEAMFGDASFGASSFPDYISIRNGRFSLVTTEGKKPAPDPLKLSFVTLAIKAPLARQYFEQAFDPDKLSVPTCLSYDGVTPEDTATEKQSETCAGCPKSLWGSTSSPSGAPIPACRQHKEIAIKVIGIDGAWLLRIPPASIRKHWAPLVDQIRKAGEKEKAIHGKPTLTMLTCVIDAEFDENTQGVLNFYPRGYADEKEQNKIVQLCADQNALMQILWGPDGPARHEKWLGARAARGGPAVSSVPSSPILPAPERIGKAKHSRAERVVPPDNKQVENEIDDVLASLGIKSNK